MYESHFGLKKRPFRALALGNDVFVGRQATGTLAAVKKGLASTDSIVLVKGPVGSGKTTLVGRALQTVGEKRFTISVGRIKLGHDEVLELLLEELGVNPLPPGTVQRFTLFRRLLKQFADKHTRVIIVVEDAVRVGADALSELEALTAADAGVSDGANIVLMGDSNFDELLASPRLARIKQRLRLRQLIEPLDGTEMEAYIEHCFRLAGAEFDAVFAAGAAAMVHGLSGGIPRLANNLLESAMTAAAEANVKPVSTEQLRAIAADEFGLESAAVAAALAEPEPPDESEPQPAPAPEAEAAAESQAPRSADPAPASASDADDHDIPELIHDTLPDLEVLAPQVATRARSDPSAERIPTLPTTPTAESGVEIPAWDRDPTQAELRPDLEALEHALAAAEERDIASKDDNAVEPEPTVKAAVPAESVPEITLDREIQAKIEEAAEAIRRTEAEAAAKAEADAEAAKSIDIADTGEMSALELPPLPTESQPEVAVKQPAPAAERSPKPAAEAPASSPESDAKPFKPAAPISTARTAAAPAANKEPDLAPKKDPELQRIARNLARAKTIDDVDEKMAETLFGEEFSAVAAEVAANAAVGDAVNDQPELQLDKDADTPALPADSIGVAKVGVEKQRQTRRPAPVLDEGASKRLATVRALNGSPNVNPPPPKPAKSVVMTEKSRSSRSSDNGSNIQIESIEQQINTSMTQNLNALNVRPRVDDGDAEDSRGGFFSRFRKS